ncbi:thiol reductant ABC exporter subunit CydD [Halomonas sp. McH1-25]|uniref:thiol reductant ABC exporter subunit CydD n=1 Tax=unclassified Halomonas TaxID=2609666 RepID=UPI001EF63DD0|nr:MULTISPECIES: thiol reductant ABC exporter subunit CydD [unclassified Halomonas]MCG7600840.1 thiol reductant ABC exporter subunit CydD [Halomonas sp. McH1-25]MCP1344406.1 thiol reductant ABC exporter subunit CydD [Halomonas sp. FL8]MCP1362418.1 thiol reductant ABC exporter subunit CydD [Halomonas sp. BBD45]
MTQDTQTSRRWLASQARHGGHWPYVAVIAGSASTLLLFVQAWAIASIAQRMVMTQATFADLLVPLLVLPLAFCGRGALAWLKTEAGTRAAVRIRQTLRGELLQRIGELGPLWARRQHSATLGNRVWDQVDALHGYYADYRPQRVLCLATPLLILLTVFPLNWAAGLILLVTAPFIPLNMAMVGIGAKQRHQAQFQEMSRMNRHFLDALRGLSTLKLFGVSRAQAEVVHEVAENFRARSMRVLRLAFLSSTLLEFFSSLSIALLAIYIGFVYLGHFDFGTWGGNLDLFAGMFILVLAPDFYQPLRDLGAHYHAKAEAEAAADDLMPLLAARPPVTKRRHGWPVPERLGITLENVTCRYAEQSAPALDDISLTIRPGETIGVVGPSGAGKSTLFNLLMGFLPPESGMLKTHDGTHIDTLAPEAWQSAIGWLGQRPAIVSGTLADNLRLADPDADDVALRQALREVALTDWVGALPLGLATPLGDGGQPVSGGEARRIALARTFLRRAPLLLLDEPVASLDRASEAHVMRTLARLKQERTLVMLTHRLDLLALADRILVLDHGRVRAIDTLAGLHAAHPGLLDAAWRHAENSHA